MLNSEIIAHKIERMRSIEYQINKGITDDFNYGVKSTSPETKSDNSLFVEKTGLEIKTAVEKEKAICTGQVDSLISSMDVIVKEIGSQPNGSYRDSGDWLVKDWIGKIDLPMKYQYDQIYQTDPMQVNNNSTANKKMIEYNDMAHRLICLNIETKKLQTIVNALNEKKTYKLTIDIASKLGF